MWHHLLILPLLCGCACETPLPFNWYPQPTQEALNVECRAVVKGCVVARHDEWAIYVLDR